MSSAGDLTGVLIAEKYELLRLIGRGGMGAVYEARNLSTLRRCAVKVLLTPELSGDSEVVKRFFREAKASGLIESDHVVAAFDSGIDAAERVYYVMECLQGEDLEQTLDRLGQLSPLAALKIALQAATGLASAHAFGVVHRDIKPANLFLAVGPGDEVKVKILDFGVAKVKMEVFNESVTTLTHGGTVLGTPLYMSPEQLRRASAIDESADVWSLGMVLFECLTGALPWGSCDGIGELVTAILTLELPPIQDLAPWVNPDVATLVLQALSRDPARRLRNGTELREAIGKLVGSDSRLYLHEIRVPDEQERQSLAPRVTRVDAVATSPAPSSGNPMVTTVSANPAARRALWPFVAAGVLASGAASWMIAPLSSARSASQPAAVVDVAEAAMSSPVAVAAPASALRRFTLEVGPPGARVSVDGSVVPIEDNRAIIEGMVGSVHDVHVISAGRSHDERVVITAEGLLPARVVVERPRPVSLKRAQSTTPPTAPASVSATAPVASAPGGLSERFE